MHKEQRCRPVLQLQRTCRRTAVMVMVPPTAAAATSSGISHSHFTHPGGCRPGSSRWEKTSAHADEKIYFNSEEGCGWQTACSAAHCKPSACAQENIERYRPARVVRDSQRCRCLRLLPLLLLRRAPAAPAAPRECTFEAGCGTRLPPPAAQPSQPPRPPAGGQWQQHSRPETERGWW